MPTIAETSQVKRLLSNVLIAEGDEKSSKRQRVRFNDSVEVLSPRRLEDKSSDRQEDDPLSIEEEDFFALSIGEDGDWDYTITTKAKEDDDVSPPAEDLKAEEPSLCKNIRAASPFAGSDQQLFEELYMMPSYPSDESMGEEAEGQLLRVSSNNSLGNNLKISIKACNDKHAPGVDDTSAAATMVPMPLITPPSSPRRVRTYSMDGVTMEEATICEWPYNLTVENAITAALELAPLSLPLGGA